MLCRLPNREVIVISQSEFESTSLLAITGKAPTQAILAEEIRVPIWGSERPEQSEVRIPKTPHNQPRGY